MDNLFTPFSIKNVTLRNRIVMPPMCMYSAGKDGKATGWHSFHYRTRAQGGTAMIIQEATAVESRGRISNSDLGLWEDGQISGMADIVRSIKAEGAVPAIQLAHAGRKCCAPGEDVIGPSAINFDAEDPHYKVPREMSAGDINNVIDAFRAAAERTLEAGYEVIEIHGAHGYLISEFLSPLTNRRSDEFGGTIEKRAEFLRRIIRAVRSVWDNEKLLILRVSALDYADKGNKPEDIAQVINLVKEEGVDIIHVSSGGVIPHVKIPAAPGFQIPPAKIIKSLTDLPVIGGGLITDPHHAGRIIKDEDSDLVFFGRELLRNPYFPYLSAKRAGIKLPYWPEQYERS